MFVPHREHTYVPPRPVTRKVLLFCMQMMFVLHRIYPWHSTACYGDSFTFLYVDGIHILYGTYLWPSTACYGDNFIFHISLFGCPVHNQLLGVCKEDFATGSRQCPGTFLDGPTEADITAAICAFAGRESNGDKAK
jgi:hypothetical protein